MDKGLFETKVKLVMKNSHVCPIIDLQPIFTTKKCMHCGYNLGVQNPGTICNLCKGT